MPRAVAVWLLLVGATCSSEAPRTDAFVPPDAPTDGPTIDLPACTVQAPPNQAPCCGKAYCTAIDPSYVCCSYAGHNPDGSSYYQWCAPPGTQTPGGPCVEIP